LGQKLKWKKKYSYKSIVIRKYMKEKKIMETRYLNVVEGIIKAYL